jgi:hypothetical protein
MKFIYLTLNIVALGIIIFTSRSYFAVKTNKLSINRTPNLLSQMQKGKLQQVVVDKVMMSDENIAIKYNLFSPNRGGTIESAGKGKSFKRNNSRISQQFKLVGVCRFGKTSGAIIIGNNRNLRSRFNRRSIVNKQEAGKSKRFYRHGDILSNGFTLTKIETRTVQLTKGRETITLEMERNNVPNREGSRPHNKAKRVSMLESQPTKHYNRGRGRYNSRMIN